MRHSLSFMGTVAITTLTAIGAATPHVSHTAVRLPGIGHTLVVQGFAVTPRWIRRAHEAGAADYVAARGDLFLLVDVRIARQSSHESYYADPQDFHIQTANGNVIDSEQFGMAAEFKAHHIYSSAREGVIGFEIPARQQTLTLLWQPTLASNPDAQAAWRIDNAGKIVQYYQ